MGNHASHAGGTDKRAGKDTSLIAGRMEGQPLNIDKGPNTGPLGGGGIVLKTQQSTDDHDLQPPMVGLLHQLIKHLNIGCNCNFVS